MKFRKFILFRLYGRGEVEGKRQRKNRFFLNFFSLRGISLYLFKQMESQWGLRFRKFPQFADFINVVNMGLFFSRAEFLSETVAKNIVRNRRT